MARRYRSALSDPAAARWLLIAVTLGFLGVFLLLPLVIVFVQAFLQGVGTYWRAAGRRRHARRDSSDLADRCDRGAAQYVVRRRRGMDGREVRISRQESA